jgi:hypothetical protein
VASNDSGWTGWLFWRGRWARACAGASIGETARKLAQRATLLRVPQGKTTLTPATAAPPEYDPTAAAPGELRPWNWASRRPSPPVAARRKEGRRHRRRGS